MSIEIQKNINTWLSQIENEYKAANSVDCVIFGYEESNLKVLVLECNMPPFEKMPSLVGDLIKPSENLEEAALRILEQRTGIKDIYLEQVSTFSDVHRHPLGRVISTAFYALVNVKDYNPSFLNSEDVVRWQNIEDIEDLAFDHNKILNVCIDRLRKAVRQMPIVFSILPQKFTLKQLQTVYEIILGVKLDKRNFRRKIKNFKLLKEHKESQQDVSHRPAKFYSLDPNMNDKIEDNGFSFGI